MLPFDSAQGDAMMVVQCSHEGGESYEPMCIAPIVVERRAFVELGDAIPARLGTESGRGGGERADVRLPIIFKNF
jgi:hypothetical protein